MSARYPSTPDTLTLLGPGKLPSTTFVMSVDEHHKEELVIVLKRFIFLQTFHSNQTRS